MEAIAFRVAFFNDGATPHTWLGAARNLYGSVYAVAVCNVRYKLS